LTLLCACVENLAHPPLKNATESSIWSIMVGTDFARRHFD
jgi:hypothetical protein